jgi:hypothetical protein
MGYSPPEGVLPFTGGQCPGSRYTAVADFNFGSGVVRAPFSETLIGPISFSTSSTTPPAFDVQIIDANGSRGWATGTTIFENIVVEPVGGDPDDCGDPPPEVRPGPDPAPDPGPIPPEEEPFEDPISGPLLPIPDLPGLPGLPPFPWRNPFSKPGDIAGDPGEAGEGVEADGLGGEDGDEVAEGEAPPGSEIVGLRLDLISALPNFPQYGDGIYRGAAYIRMGTVAGLDQDFGGAQVEDGQFFYAEREGLTQWRVTANIGISWLVTPFYREVN